MYASLDHKDSNTSKSIALYFNHGSPSCFLISRVC